MTDDPGPGWWLTESGEWRQGNAPEGWWQASDLHWYPPSAPSAAASDSGLTSPAGSAPASATVTLQRRWFIALLAGLFLLGAGLGVAGAADDDDELGEELAAAQDELDDIITNDFVTDGPVIVEIAESDVAFSSQGCGEWEPTE